MSKFENLAAYVADMKGGIEHFKTTQRAHNIAAHFCAVAAISLFVKDGNLEGAKQFREALDTNAKQNQFVKWLCDSSGGVGNSTVIQFAENKFRKNKEATADNMAALAGRIAELEGGESFLKYKQQPKVTQYNAESVRDKVLGTIKRVLSSDKSEAVSDEHRVWVQDIEADIRRLFANKPCPAMPANAK